MDEIRDIYYTKNRHISQLKTLKNETSRINYKDWLFFEEWKLSQNIKLNTILKHLFSFYAILRLYPTKNLKKIPKTEIIELCYTITSSNYADHTKKAIQITLKQYLILFAQTKKRKESIFDYVKVLSCEDIAEVDHLISHNDFNKILKHMHTNELKDMVRVLYGTGMRITELYNIRNCSESLFFTAGGVWINTKGKRTKQNKAGTYHYYLTFFISDLRKYTKTIKPQEYLFNISATYFNKCLKKAIELENLNFRIYPHLFRHTMFTELTNIIPLPKVFKILNLSKNSKMAKYYSHQYDQDVIDSMNILKKHRK